MVVAKSVLKILLLISAFVVIYFGGIYFLNLFLDLNKPFVRSFISEMGINVDFEDISLDYSLVLKVSNVSLSNENFSVELDNCFMHIDFRKLMLRQIPLNLFEASNVNIYLVNTSNFNSKSSNQNFYDLVHSLRNSMILLKDVNFSSGGFNVKLGSLIFKIKNNDSVSFDIKTPVKVGSTNFVRLAYSLIDFSGVAFFKRDGEVSDFSAILSLKSNEVLGVNFRDITISFSMDKGNIIGASLSEEYYGYLEFSKSSFKGSFYIKDLLKSASQVEQIRNIYKIKSIIPEIDRIVKELLVNTEVDFEITTNTSFVKVNSSNLNIIYENSDNHLFLFNYLNGDKKISISFLGRNLKAVFRNIIINNVPASIYLSSTISNDTIVVNKGYINTPLLNGDIFGGLVVNKDKFYIDNNYIKAEARFSDFTGYVVFKDVLVFSVVENLKLPFRGLPSISINFNKNGIVLFGNNDKFDIKLFINENNIFVESFSLSELGIFAKGSVTISNDFWLGKGVLSIKGISDNVSIYGNSRNVSIEFGKYGRLVFYPDNSYALIDLRAIRIGSFDVRKVYGQVGNGNLSLNCEVGFGEVSALFKVLGDQKRVVITNGYLYTKNKAMDFSGSLDIGESMNAYLVLGNSKVNLRLSSNMDLDISGDFRNFYFPILFVYKIDGTLRLKANVLEKDFIKMIKEINANLLLKSEGFFNKVKLSIGTQNGLINANAVFFNYYNTFILNGKFDNSFNLYLSLLYKDRLNPQSRNKEIVRIEGSFTSSDEFRGKLFVDTEGFSGLNESWSKDIIISKDTFFVEGGDNSGINVFKDSRTLRVYYIRNGKVVYEFMGDIINDGIYGYMTGRIPMNFLIIPDFLEEVDGELVLDKVKVLINGNKLDLDGRASISGKIKTAFSDSYFSIPKTEIQLQDGKILADKVRLTSSDVEMLLSSIVYLDDVINPRLDIKLYQSRGILNCRINVGGGLSLEGPTFSLLLNIGGSANSPAISGNINFVKGAKVKYFMMQLSQQDTEFWGYNFAQLADWNLSISISNSAFESEVVDGVIEDGKVYVRGNFSKNTLSIVGYSDISSGTLKYLGKYFSIDSLRLIFYGDEMDFVPFVRGTLYTYAYDNRTDENIKILMNVSGKATSFNTSFSSDPERSQSEIAMLLGLPVGLGDTVKQGLSLIETIGIYDFISYNVRRYTGLDVFSFRSPFVFTYFNSLIGGSYQFSTKDLLKGTELRVGKNILPSLLLEYSLAFDVVGDSISYTNVLLHNFLLGWTFYNFALELQYSSFLIGNKTEFEPKVNVRFNKRF